MLPRLFVPPIDPAALAGHDPRARVVALDGETMGTTWRVLYAEVEGRTPEAIRVAIERRLRALMSQLSHWDEGSALCAFNRAPAGRWVGLPDDLANVVDAALRIAGATGGAFDPAIGALVDLWGFGPPGAMPLPSEDALAVARERSGYTRLRWDRAARRLQQAGGVALDLSGIAKGYAVDAIADLLGALAIRHCLIEIGGELAGRGLRPDSDPWWVDLELPPGVMLPPLRAALHQCAVATSGAYRRGEHTIDPRTGRAPTNGVVAVSVIARSAMLADALASAAAVLLPNDDVLSALEVSYRAITVIDGAAHEVRGGQLSELG